MGQIELNNSASYFEAYQANASSGGIEAKELDKKMNINSDEIHKHKIHNSAVNVSISMESLKVYLNIKSAEFSQDNSNAQSTLLNMVNNQDIYSFLSGKAVSDGFSLSSLGYNGKPITELNQNEAKELVSENGFFGVSQTSQRVSSFVIGLAGDNLEALNEVRAGVVQGFEEAEKLWGGTLPDISYETQKKTLAIIDEKIASLGKTDTKEEQNN